METHDRRDSERRQAQMDYLYEYIVEHSDLERYDLYCDNGENSSNFVRLEFQRMMDIGWIVALNTHKPNV